MPRENKGMRSGANNFGGSKKGRSPKDGNTTTRKARQKRFSSDQMAAAKRKDTGLYIQGVYDRIEKNFRKYINTQKVINEIDLYKLLITLWQSENTAVEQIDEDVNYNQFLQNGGFRNEEVKLNLRPSIESLAKKYGPIIGSIVALILVSRMADPIMKTVSGNSAVSYVRSAALTASAAALGTFVAGPVGGMAAAALVNVPSAQAQAVSKEEYDRRKAQSDREWKIWNHGYKASTFGHEGKYKEAIEHGLEYLKLNPEDGVDRNQKLLVHHYIQFALQLAEEGKHRDAIVNYEAAIVYLNYSDIKMRYLEILDLGRIADAYIALKDYKRLANHYKNVIKQFDYHRSDDSSPNMVTLMDNTIKPYYLKAGMAYEKAYDIDNAIKYFKMFHEKDNRYGDGDIKSIDSLIRIYYETGKFEDLKDYLYSGQKDLRYNRSPWRVLKLLAEEYREKDGAKKAIEFYEVVSEIYPTYPSLKTSLANLYYESGISEDNEEYIQKAADLGNFRAYVHVTQNYISENYPSMFSKAAVSILAIAVAYQGYKAVKFEKGKKQNVKGSKLAIKDFIDITYIDEDHPEYLQDIAELVDKNDLVTMVQEAFNGVANIDSPNVLGDKSAKLLQDLLNGFRIFGNSLRTNGNNIFANTLRARGAVATDSKQQPLFHRVAKGKVGADYVTGAVEAIYLLAKENRQEQKGGIIIRGVHNDGDEKEVQGRIDPNPEMRPTGQNGLRNRNVGGEGVEV